MLDQKVVINAEQTCPYAKDAESKTKVELLSKELQIAKSPNFTFVSGAEEEL